MIKFLIIIFVSLLFHPLKVLPQMYCFMEFSYKGTLISDSLHHYKIATPYVNSLEEYNSFDSCAFEAFNFTKQKFTILTSASGCNYCYSEHVENVIKERRNYFPVRIFVREKTEPITVLVPSTQIKFISSTKKRYGAFIVDLGEIRY